MMKPLGTWLPPGWMLPGMRRHGAIVRPVAMAPGFPSGFPSGTLNDLESDTFERPKVIWETSKSRRLAVQRFKSGVLDHGVSFPYHF